MILRTDRLCREKANKTNYSFRMAQQGDVKQILSLYQKAKSDTFCVWNDEYPSLTEIGHDLETENLYVMTEGDKIIGAISVVPENELDAFDCWSCKDGKEIARVVIDKACQGRGLAFELVQSITSILCKKGHKAIHLSVVKSNIPAYKTYIKAGFVTVGEAQMYGNRYYLMEKAIGTNFPPKRITDEKVIAQCDWRNGASAKVMEKIGMRLIDDKGMRTYTKREESARELTYCIEF